MSKTNFLKLKLQNYGTYDRLDFEIKPGRHLIIGENRSSPTEESNGSGKSLIFESGADCFYKAGLRDKDPSTNQKGDCSVEWEFEKDNKHYRVKRHYGWKEDLDYNPHLFIDHTETQDRKSKAANSNIIDILNIPLDLFLSTVVVAQGLPKNFGILPPVARLSLMENMIGFSIWNKLRKPVSSIKDNIRLDFSKLEFDFNKKKDEMVSLNHKIELQKALQKQADDNWEEQHQEIFEKVSKSKSALKKEKDILKEVLDGNNLNMLRSEVKQLSGTIFMIKKQQKDIHDLIENKVCPTCNQNYPEQLINSKMDDFENNKKKINEASLRLNKYEEISNKSFNIEKNINHYQSLIEQLKVRLLELNKKKDSQDNKVDISPFLKRLEELTQHVNVLKEELDDQKSNIEHLEYIDSLLLPSSKFRTQLLEKYLDYINQILDSVLPMLIDKVECRLKVTDKEKGLDFEIKKEGIVRGYKSLSGGEKRKLDVALILSFQKFLVDSSGVNTNLLVFDEIFDSLDNLGIVNVLSCIDNLFPQSSSIYVITHNDVAKNYFDSVIKVVKENDISRIEETA